MQVFDLPMHDGLSARSRLRSIGAIEQTQLWELIWLISMGAAAATAATFMDWSLGIPGHAILRIVFPMTLGLALVPRHGGGIVMGVSATATTALFASCGAVTPGLGAMTSLMLFGPVLDLALWRAKRGWLLFTAFAAAGVISNLVAFFARGGGRLLGLRRAFPGAGRGVGQGGGMGGGHGLGGRGLVASGQDSWWSYAPVSYLVCGLVAGLLCAAIWFSVCSRRSDAAKGRQL